MRVFVEADGYEKTDAHELRTVVSLCLACHRKADFGRLSRARLWESVGVDPDEQPVIAGSRV